MKDQERKTPDELAALIQALQDDRDKKLKEIYRLYREEFLNWARSRTKLSEEDLLDVFQEAIIVFYKKVSSGALTKLSASVKTYLFGIAKKKLYKQQAMQGRYDLQEDIREIKLPEHILNPVYEKIEHQHLVDMIRQALQKLGDPCRKLIQLAFYDNFSLESIAIRMNYKNSQVVSSQLYKCTKRIKKLLDGKL